MVSYITSEAAEWKYVTIIPSRIFLGASGPRQIQKLFIEREGHAVSIIPDLREDQPPIHIRYYIKSLPIDRE